jgi:cytochrome b6-f complex iron-sulfur subunit
VRTSGGDILVARTGADTFAALSAGCTHQSCEITGYSGQTFVCPCHGSRFDTSGHVVQGPAPTALRQFQTQFADDVLTVTA